MRNNRERGLCTKSHSLPPQQTAIYMLRIAILRAIMVAKRAYFGVCSGTQKSLTSVHSL